MCEPITMMMMGGIGAAMGIASSVTNAIVQAQSVNAQNQAIADQYEQELRNEEMRMNMEREEAALQAENEAQSEVQAAADENLQIKQMAARSEAANASLNVSGNTALRGVGAYDVQANVAQGRHEQNMETIENQYLMRQRSSIGQYNMNTTAAQLSARSQMQSGSPWWATGLSILGAGIQGASSGAQLGKSLDGISWGTETTTATTNGVGSGSTMKGIGSGVQL